MTGMCLSSTVQGRLVRCSQGHRLFNILIAVGAGLPKAIRLAHRYLLGYAACHLFPPDEDESKRGINLSTLPLFHVRRALKLAWYNY